jgi:glucokinase
MGAVCGGKILAGSDGFGCEFGHFKIDLSAQARLCNCGERGCIEAYTAGKHLSALFGREANAAQIEAAAVSGDGQAIALWQQISWRLGMALSHVIALLNPRVLVLGGGVLGHAPSLKKQVVTCVQQFAPKPHIRHLRIADSKLGDDAGVIGAALLALKGLS